MSLRNTIRTAALAAAIGTAVLAVPSTSWAADNFLDQCGGATVSCQTGTSSAAPADADYCKIESSTRTRVCVKYVGDIVWVKDDAADGNSALARLNGDQGSIHQRFCRNPHGAGIVGPVQLRLGRELPAGCLRRRSEQPVELHSHVAGVDPRLMP